MEREWGKTFRPNRDDVWVCTLSEAKSLRVWVWWRFLWLFFESIPTFSPSKFTCSCSHLSYFGGTIHFSIQSRAVFTDSAQLKRRIRHKMIHLKTKMVGKVSFGKCADFPFASRTFFFFWQTFPHYIFFLLAVLFNHFEHEKFTRHLHPPADIAPPKNVWNPFKQRKIPVFFSALKKLQQSGELIQRCRRKMCVQCILFPPFHTHSLTHSHPPFKCYLIRKLILPHFPPSSNGFSRQICEN